MIDHALIVREILKGYTLDANGIHGPVHWIRVMETGLRLAELTGANADIVTLFALFHDARRVNDGTDHGHGRRGAELAATMRGKLFDLNDADFKRLTDACTYHTDRMVAENVTTGVCWDADRLDLPRCGIVTSRGLLSTEAAKAPAIYDWATERGRSVVCRKDYYHAAPLKYRRTIDKYGLFTSGDGYVYAATTPGWACGIVWHRWPNQPLGVWKISNHEFVERIDGADCIHQGAIGPESIEFFAEYPAVTLQQWGAQLILNDPATPAWLSGAIMALQKPGGQRRLIAAIDDAVRKDRTAGQRPQE